MLPRDNNSKVCRSQIPCKGLVTNYGEGGYKTGGGAREVLPLQKGGGGHKRFGVVFTWYFKRRGEVFRITATTKNICNDMMYYTGTLKVK